MGSYREKLEIVADILKVINKGERVKKTQIMYQANLSYRLLMKYLDNVVKACLVNIKKREGCYILTSKGKKFLENYSDYYKRQKSIEKKLNDVRDKKKMLEELYSHE